jgi:tetratricopeptide (TPR) repeat protein
MELHFTSKMAPDRLLLQQLVQIKAVDFGGTMEPSSGAVADKEFKRALKELEEENILAALACLEKALKIWDDPTWYSRLGFCIAKERGHVTRGVELCKTAINHEPENPDHYLYLGKLYLMAGRREEGLQAFRQGMSHGGNHVELKDALEKNGTRKPPPIPFLHRDNPLNKYIGIILGRLGVR